MPEISFALILSDNLKLKDVKIKQIESVITVKGDLDPKHIQAIRDHVDESFKQRRKNINDLIVAKVKEARAAGDQQKAKAILVELDKGLAKATAAFDKKIQTMVTDFCEHDEELRQEAQLGRWQYVVSTLWSLGSIYWDGSKAVAGVVASPGTGGGSIALAAKGVFDLARDIMSFYDSQKDAWRGVDEQEKRIIAALGKIKKVKKGSPIPQSDIDAAELALAPFGPKVEALDKTARGFSTRLVGMLDAAEKLPAGKSKAQMEAAIKSFMIECTDLGKLIAQRRDLQKRAKDTIRTAMTKAKADPWSYVTWATGIYEKVNGLVDIAKGAEDMHETCKNLLFVANTFFQKTQEALKQRVASHL